MTYEEKKQQFVAEAMKLIEAELLEGTSDAATVLFGDELGADDWRPEDAVNALFKYASAYGWGV